MMRLKVTVEPIGPLLLGSGWDTQNVRESRHYIAGSVLRGALAEGILSRLGAHQNSAGRLPQIAANDTRLDGFRAVFTQRPAARFGHLYPVTWSAAAPTPDTFPAPVTAFACKPHGDKQLGNHPLQDALGAWLRDEPPPMKCRCGARLERYRGIVNYPRAVPIRPLVRVGLNRLTEAAQDQALYTLGTLEPSAKHPLAFTGYWHMTAPQWTQLEAMLNESFLPDGAARSWQLRIGSARARGLGEARLRVLPVAANALAELDARLTAFQTLVPQADRLHFSLTARAPLLVYDALGAPALRLTPAILQSYGVLLPTGIAEGCALVESDRLSGWSQAWGLPKPVSPAIAAGSVFTYSVPPTERDSLLGFLQALETDGLGERRAEGFGELFACDQFHVQPATQHQAAVA